MKKNEHIKTLDSLKNDILQKIVDDKNRLKDLLDDLKMEQLETT